MKLFKSNERNTFHYVTLVTYNRVCVFRSDEACRIFTEVLAEVREKFPYKLIGYLLMPDHVHAIINWQKDPSVIDLWSPKFVRQKLNYLHLNPVRAGLCKHSADWKWSSYRAYLPHRAGDVPIEVDWQAYWKD